MSRDKPRDESEQEREAGGRSLLKPAPLKWKSSDSILGDQKSSAPILGDAKARGAEKPTVREAVPEPAPYEEPEQLAPAASAERAARWFLLAAVFLVPLVFHPETIDAFSLAKMEERCRASRCIHSVSLMKLCDYQTATKRSLKSKSCAITASIPTIPSANIKQEFSRQRWESRWRMLNGCATARSREHWAMMPVQARLLYSAISM